MASTDTSSNIVSTTVASTGTSITPSPGTRDIDIKVVVIVVSTIGSVLLMAIILAVIFLKRPKVERVEHVYAVPTPCDSSSGTGPNSTGTLKNERPILRDCYCEVADAIPTSRITANPASPGYAEVEDVCKGDNCRWDPHKFTFGPSIRLPDFNMYSNQPGFDHTGSYLTGSPMHMRTLSDSTPLRTSPFLGNKTLGRSFRDPKSTDYEEVIIDNQRRNPRFVHKDQENLLQSRLSRATAAAKSSSPYGVQCIPVKPTLSPEGLYATSSVINTHNQSPFTHEPRALDSKHELKPRGTLKPQTSRYEQQSEKPQDKDSVLKNRSKMSDKVSPQKKYGPNLKSSSKKEPSALSREVKT